VYQIKAVENHYSKALQMMKNKGGYGSNFWSKMG